ncbi:MAG: DMT family transporter [Proteobacteria bacterium]|nr:DMT family transporter [Pseudomonadota bacterium]MBU1712501.1 DMT family transporter [Pseudomonadota bacterium]
MKPSNTELSFSAALITVFVCIIFGANYVAVKVGLAGMGIFTSAAIRFAIAAVAIALWAKATGQTFTLKKGQFNQIIILTFIFTAQLSLFYLGMSRTSATHATLVSNFLPFFILFLAHFFIPGDRITIRKLTGILLGFAGIVFIFLEKEKGAPDLKTGDIIIFTAAFIWACNTVYVKRIINNFHSFQLVLYPMIFSVPLFFLEAFLWDEKKLFNINMAVLASLFYQSIITAAFGFVVWNRLLKNYGATSLHSFIFIIPLAGVLFGRLLLYEPITCNILFALILITSGILVVHLKPVATPVFPLGRGL